MPNPGDFDPAEAIRQQRAAEEARKAEKQRAQAAQDLRRANILKLLRYADEQVEVIRNPVVSEFVIGETWVTRSIFVGRKRHHQREQDHYYGSWLALSSTRDPSHSRSRDNRSGLVKLRQPRAGYALVSIKDWDPRNVGYFSIPLTDDRGGKRSSRRIMGPQWTSGAFQIVASLEEAMETRFDYPDTASLFASIFGSTSGEQLTKSITQALDFVATGQPPEPEIYSPEFN